MRDVHVHGVACEGMGDDGGCDGLRLGRERVRELRSAGEHGPETAHGGDLLCCVVRVQNSAGRDSVPVRQGPGRESE